MDQNKGADKSGQKDGRTQRWKAKLGIGQRKPGDAVQPGSSKVQIGTNQASESSTRPARDTCHASNASTAMAGAAAQHPLIAGASVTKASSAKATGQVSSLTSLWDEAYTQLSASDEMRKALEAYESLILQQIPKSTKQPLPELSKLSASERELRLRDVLNHRLAAAKTEEWKIHNLSVKESARKIVGAITWSQGFISAAVSSNPHASLAWAGVTCFLPLLVNPATQDEAVLDALSYVYPLLCRYQLIERDLFHYKSQRLQSNTKEVVDLAGLLRKTVVDLYCEVLNLELRLAVHFARHFTWTYFRDIVKWDNWEDQVQKIKAIEVEGDKIIVEFSNHGIHDIADSLATLQKDLDLRLDDLHNDIQMIKDATVQKGKSTQSSLYLVPRSGHSLFTGRRDLLEKIRTLLPVQPAATQTQQTRIIITGLGGQGKSELCLQTAEQMQRQNINVFWVNVSTEASAQSDFLNIARKLGVEVEHLEEAVQTLANLDRAWLLVLDNADDTERDYHQYFPPGNCGSVMMTSRNPDNARYARPADAHIVLEGLQEEDALLLLLKASGHRNASDDDQVRSDALKVVHLLNSHTLALVQAGSYISKGFCRLAEYSEVYSKKWRKLIGSVDGQERSRYGSVFATFEASREVLAAAKTEQSEDAINLLDCLAMMNAKNLPIKTFHQAWIGARNIVATFARTANEDTEQMFWPLLLDLKLAPAFTLANSEVWDHDRVINACHLLRQLSLVFQEGVAESGLLSVHTLINEWTRKRQDENTYDGAWLAAGSVLAMARLANLEQLPQQMYLHAKAICSSGLQLRWAQENISSAVRIFWTLSGVLGAFGDSTSELKYLMRVFELLSIDPGRPETPKFFRLHRDWAHRTAYNGDPQRGLAILEELARREKVLPAQLPSHFETDLYLSQVYLLNQQPRQALLLLTGIVTNLESVAWPAEPLRIEASRLLGRTYRELGLLKQALESLSRAYELSKQHQSWNDRSLLNVEADFADALITQGKAVTAIQILELRLRFPAQMGKYHLLQGRNQLARAYLSANRQREALELLDDGLEDLNSMHMWPELAQERTFLRTRVYINLAHESSIVSATDGLVE